MHVAPVAELFSIYVVMAVVSGAVDVRGVRDFVQSALKQRKASRANT